MGARLQARHSSGTAATQTIRVGHTPDMDDAFMFFGIAAGAVAPDGLRFEHVIEEIEALNQRAARGELEATAISAASYPRLAEDYALLSVGASVGDGYGPLLVAARPLRPEQLRRRRIAVPGSGTTACALLRLAIQDVEPVELPFAEIPEAVLGGTVEAGLVIHEWQLTFRDAGLHPVLDLGAWWRTQTRLPLPLGLNVVKRSLGRATAVRVAAALRDSVLYALAHRQDALAHAMRYGRGTDPARSSQFVGMYVNEHTLTLSRSCRQALRMLFARIHRAGLAPRAPRLTVIEPPKP